MSTLRIGNDDPAYTAYAVAHLRAEIANRNNMKLNSYFIISGEHFMDGIGVPGNSAHSGTPILFVAKNQVPKYTKIGIYDSDHRFGWNRNKKGRGDAFSFVPVHQWQNAAVATLFSQYGKTCPDFEHRTQSCAIICVKIFTSFEP